MREPLGQLLLRARAQLECERSEIAELLHVSVRTLVRWERGETRPELRATPLIPRVYVLIDHGTWLAIVHDLGVPLAEMLAAVPHQADLARQAAEAARPPPPPQPPPAAPPSPTHDEVRAALDEAIRASAEELDVTARRLRSTFATLLADVERLRLTPADARDVLLGRRAKPR